MAYMRGEWYVWGDGENTHFNDFSMPDELVDEFVAMRWAQMSEDEWLTAQRRAAENWGGNFGCIELCDHLGVPNGLDMLKCLVAEREEQNTESKP